MSWIASIRARAAATRRRILFPESGDMRTLAAVRLLAEEQIVDPVLVLDPAHPETHAAARGAGVAVIDPASDPRTAAVADALFARRQAKGMTADEARKLSATPLIFADGLVHAGEADGCVAGAVFTSREVLRAALWVIGVAPGVTTVSSAFYMVVPAFRGDASHEVLTFTDCSVVPYPAAAQLADIAIAAATARRRIVGDEPRVAFLSFSTKGSADGASVSAVLEALALVRARLPGLAVDGELQVDAALIAAIGARKAPESAVAGSANILVFPSLDAGNIGYKLVQRLCGADAIGPILQGLALPCSDLSRGASTDDIINVAAITALQAGSAG